MFKPLFTESELALAEQDIGDAVRELAAARTAETGTTGIRPVIAEPEPEPSIATSLVEEPVTSRILAKVGFPARRRRLRLRNTISKTVALGCSNGLYRRSKASGIDAYQLVAAVYPNALEPDVSEESLLVILGSVRAAIRLACPNIPAERMRGL